jgi:NAD(P)-dependent dehydrogenase (short-subunit alcohol dehydrogenase family)
MSKVEGKVAVVTGAGSGIGRALALELTRRGAKVAVSDVRQEGLDETARLLGIMGATPHAQLLDVSDRDAFEAYAQTVSEHFGRVHQIYNNAGVASGKRIIEASYELYEKVIGVNLWGVIHGTKAFLPHLIASGDGHVTNISSLNGYMAQSELSAYCTTKFAVRGFTETLRIEMTQDKLPVKVTVVHPGGVKTGIASNALEHAAELGFTVTQADRDRSKTYNEKLLKMDPAVAANIIIDGVEADKARVRVGNDAKLVDYIVRCFPVSYQRVTLALDRLTMGKRK